MNFEAYAKIEEAQREYLRANGWRDLGNGSWSNDHITKRFVRSVVSRLDKEGTPKNASKIVEPLREALRERGLGPRCHEGRKDLTLEQTPEQIVEWYAGQVVEVVDSRAWHTVNTVTNLLDKFVPEGDLS